MAKNLKYTIVGCYPCGRGEASPGDTFVTHESGQTAEDAADKARKWAADASLCEENQIQIVAVFKGAHQDLSVTFQGTEGQDRKNYTDKQDRKNYT